MMRLIWGSIFGTWMALMAHVCPPINIAAVLGTSPVAMARIWLCHSSDLSEECKCPPHVLEALAQSVLHGNPCSSHSVFYLFCLWNGCHNWRKLALLCVCCKTMWYNYYHYVVRALLGWTGLSCSQANSLSQIENTWKKSSCQHCWGANFLFCSASGEVSFNLFTYILPCSWKDGRCLIGIIYRNLIWQERKMKWTDVKYETLGQASCLGESLRWGVLSLRTLFSLKGVLSKWS